MKTLVLIMLPLGVALNLVALPDARAAGARVEASIRASASPQREYPLPESIEATAARWERELDRVAFLLEERALVESGDDAMVQSLLARADHLKVQRVRLQECFVRQPSELARSLQRSVERTPEAAPMERLHVSAVLGGLAASDAP